MDWIRRWWRQPDHYQWLSDYLAARNQQAFTRYMMAVVVLLLGTVPVLMLFTPAGPRGTVPRGLSIVVAIYCVAVAALWLARWPSRRQSAAFVVTSSACISVACLVEAWPGTAMQSCSAFAALAGYAAFFHTSRYLVFTLSVAVGTGLVCATQIAAAGDPALAASKLLILVVGTLAVPFAIQILVHTLGLDALRSDIDPLTDLPNRRSFRRSVHGLASESRRDGTAQLTVVMVDLDDFKRINDTAGHAAGDRTLVAVAEILRRSRRGDSVIGRVGGEEFVVALCGDRRDAAGLAERIRREIARVPLEITASIGVASSSLFQTHPDQIRHRIDDLLESADRAMYDAKRAGGDRVHVAPCSDAHVAKPSSTPDVVDHRAPAVRVPPEFIDAEPTVATATDAS